MKVALITGGILSYVMGGMQRHSYYLSKYLSHSYAKVELYHVIDKTNMIDLAFKFMFR
jgi:hypothetical protein